MLILVTFKMFVFVGETTPLISVIQKSPFFNRISRSFEIVYRLFRFVLSLSSTFFRTI